MAEIVLCWAQRSVGPALTRLQHIYRTEGAGVDAAWPLCMQFNIDGDRIQCLVLILTEKYLHCTQKNKLLV